MNPTIELTNLSLSRQGRAILHQINWRMDSNQHWVILGLNGSGKTSLLTLVMGYEWPSEGQVAVLGHEYGTVDLRQLRRQIGWVSNHLIEWMTRDHGHVQVKDLINAGPEAVIGKTAHTSPRTAHALQTFHLDTVANSRFSQLSQGEKTRVLLARAWIMDVRLLILDEPTSGLDIKRREEFLTLIGTYLRQTNSVQVIYVTHHPEEIRPEFTHALLIKEGKIVAQGPRDHVLTDPLLSHTFDIEVETHMMHGRIWVQIKEASHQPSNASR